MKDISPIAILTPYGGKDTTMLKSTYNEVREVIIKSAVEHSTDTRVSILDLLHDLREYYDTHRKGRKYGKLYPIDNSEV